MTGFQQAKDVDVDNQPYVLHNNGDLMHYACVCVRVHVAGS